MNRRTATLFAALVAAAASFLWWWKGRQDDEEDDGDTVGDDDDTPEGTPTVANDLISTLAGNARAAATELHRVYPSMVVTSGRRDKTHTANAMASKVVQALRLGNDQWLTQTYVDHADAGVLQDAIAGLTVEAEIADRILGVIYSWTDEQLGRISKHPAGEAFDVRIDSVPDEALQAMVDQHNANGGKAKLLKSEGGVPVRHLQFDDAVQTTFVIDTNV